MGPTGNCGRLIPCDNVRYANLMSQPTLSSLRQACVIVRAGGRCGTGFFVRSDLVLTCLHVVKDAVDNQSPIIVELRSRSVAAHLSSYDYEQDVAALRLDDPVGEIAPLSIAATGYKISVRQAVEFFGFPSSANSSGQLFHGEVDDVCGQDLRGGSALVIYSRNITAGAELQGFSGSPVCSKGVVIGQLRQIIPDAKDGAQFGRVFASPISHLNKILLTELSVPTEPVSPKLKTLPSHYDKDAYIQRPQIERDVLNWLATHGRPTLIWGPRQSGKNWVISHVISTWKSDHSKSPVVTCDVRQLILNLSSEEKVDGFLLSLARDIARQLLGEESGEQFVATYWNVKGGVYRALENTLDRLLRVCQSEKRTPLVLVLYCADHLLTTEYCDSFFNMLRGWAQLDRDPWRALRVLVEVSTSPARLTKSIYSSPFVNLTEPLRVESFTVEQVEELARLYGVECTVRELKAIHQWLGGHPHLTSVLFYRIKSGGSSVREKRRNPPAEFSRHVENYRQQLEKNRSLKDALQRIHQDPLAAVSRDAIEELTLSGLIVRSKHQGQDGYRLAAEIYRELIEAPHVR